MRELSCSWNSEPIAVVGKQCRELGSISQLFDNANTAKWYSCAICVQRQIKSV